MVTIIIHAEEHFFLMTDFILPYDSTTNEHVTPNDCWNQNKAKQIKILLHLLTAELWIRGSHSLVTGERSMVL